MPKKSVLDKDLVLDTIKKCEGNLSRAAKQIGVSRSTLRHRYNSIKSGTALDLNDTKSQDSTVEFGDNVVANKDSEYISYSVKGDNLLDFVCLARAGVTAEEIAKKSGYDMRKWKVTEVKFNQWQVAGKKRNGQEEGTKRWLAEDLWKEQLYQIKFKLERRAPKIVQDGVERLMENWVGPQKMPKIQHRQTLARPHMLEISLFDVHFGKLAWSEETGEDYNLKIAENIYLNAVDDLFERAKVFDIDRIVFPVGQDFFNVDNWQGQTANGTLVESTDDRFTKIFTVGCEAVKWAVMRCRNVAPVHVMWSPGNHDRSTSWYLCKAIQQYCMGAEINDVTFDLGPNQRKYELYGNTLIGFTHSCDERLVDLPLIMAKEEKLLWAQADYHQWHVGHYHKKKEMRFIAGDTFNGVSVTILPSLSATDSFHYRNGWTKPHRAAEAYLWSQDRGLSDFMVHTI